MSNSFLIRTSKIISLALLVVALPIACSSSPRSNRNNDDDDEGEGGEAGTPGPTSSSVGTGGSGGAGGSGGGTNAECGPDVALPEEVLSEESDPEAGNFTLDEALADLPAGPGPLRAIIDTDKGAITCELFADKVPNGVANFVGLARGRRPWRDPATMKWVKRRFYDGLLFHRVIPEFMAQGGDPLGTGYGNPGYMFNDEIVADLKHQPGTLAYANSGADTNGSQFYITELTTSFLDGGYTVFGQCDPVSVVTELTHVETDADDKPVVDLHIKTVTITRCAP